MTVVLCDRQYFYELGTFVMYTAARIISEGHGNNPIVQACPERAPGYRSRCHFCMFKRGVDHQKSEHTKNCGGMTTLYFAIN